ncbi:MAG: ABC transporter permease [Pirellulales bacterium]
MKLFLLIARNVRRSYVRSGLTVLGTMVLVFVMTLVWSILAFLGDAMAEKSSNFKAIVTERWQIPSQMPFAYADSLSQGAATKPDDVRPTDSMTWQFYGGTTEKGTRTRENTVFAFGMQPSKINTMMDDLDSLPAKEAAELQAVIDKLESNRQGLILGRDRLAALKKQVGDRITLYGINYKDIDLEFEIVGTVPAGRYDNNAFFNRDYLLAAIDQYNDKHTDPHPLTEKSLNLVWLRVPDAETLRKVTAQIDSSSDYTNPQVKCETQSSGISAFMEAYSGLIWAMKYVLSPVIFVTLALVIATAISIAVRERRTELAVMKVLGFRPWQLLLLVLGEATLLGLIGGGLSAAATYVVVNIVMGGLKFQIGFFAAFFIPAAAIGWGLALGGGAALLGSVMPAFAARSVKVAEVFSKVA